MKKNVKLLLLSVSMGAVIGTAIGIPFYFGNNKDDKTENNLKEELLKHLKGNNLKIIIKKDDNFVNVQQIFLTTKKIIESRPGIDSSHTKFMKLKPGQTTIHSVANWYSPPTNLIILIDDKEIILKLNKSRQVNAANDFVTNLNLDNIIYNDSTAKILDKPDDSNTQRTIYIESKNLIIRTSLSNPHLRGLADSEELKKVSNNDAKTIGENKMRIADVLPSMEPWGTKTSGGNILDTEKNAIKKSFKKTDVEINALLPNMKIWGAFSLYVGDKYDENSNVYDAWESLDKNDYIFSNSIWKINQTTTKAEIKKIKDEIIKKVDLPGFTGVFPRAPKVEKIVVEVSKTSYWEKTVNWYKKYFSASSK